MTPERLDLLAELCDEYDAEYHRIDREGANTANHMQWHARHRAARERAELAAEAQP